MHKNMWVSAILLAGGEGVRFGTILPKQFNLILCKPVYIHTIECFLDISSIDEIIVVCQEQFLLQVEKECAPYLKVRCCQGGSTRQASSLKGLHCCSPQTQLVIIHDAVRPCVSAQIILENISCAYKTGAVDTCIPAIDTIVQSKNDVTVTSIPPRSEYWQGQTPQTFHYDLIYAAHKNALKCGLAKSSDDCQLVLNMGHPVQIVRGSVENIKITNALDFQLAKLLLARSKSSDFIKLGPLA